MEPRTSRQFLGFPERGEHAGIAPMHILVPGNRAGCWVTSPSLPAESHRTGGASRRSAPPGAVPRLRVCTRLLPGRRLHLARAEPAGPRVQMPTRPTRCHARAERSGPSRRRCHRCFESLRSLQGSPPAPRSWPACSCPPTGPASKAGWPEASPSDRRGPGPHGRSATPHTGRRRQRHSSVPLPQITARAGASSCKENASILCISLGCKL